MKPRRPPKGDQRGAMEPRRVTKGGQVGPNRPTRAPRGSKRWGYQRGQENPKEGVGASQRAQERLKGIPQSELDDSYTVSEGPESGRKGINHQKPRGFELF